MKPTVFWHRKALLCYVTTFREYLASSLFISEDTINIEAEKSLRNASNYIPIHTEFLFENVTVYIKTAVREPCDREIFRQIFYSSICVNLQTAETWIISYLRTLQSILRPL